MGFQDIFHSRSKRSAREKADTTETFKTLVDARFDRLESNFALLKAEWLDTHEKMTLLYDRNRKRLKALQTASQPIDVPEPTPAPPQTADEVLRAYLRQNGH